ncbi:MAG: relaxase/mobilization nuclease RlxS [Henriciella sp.]
MSDRGKLFDQSSDDIDRQTFADHAKNDRHHFRLIVSPEDGAQLQDMKPFVRDLVSSMESDLDTQLEWTAAVHDNTDHPHAHIVIRGKRDDGRDLVMPRAYISHGIRERAEELITLELGPQTQLERDLKLARQTSAERLTEIDRTLARFAGEGGKLDLSQTPARYLSVNAARLRTLKKLGLAKELTRSKWTLAEDFSVTLKTLGERDDIIKQIHRGLKGETGRKIDPSAILEPGQSVTGKVLRIGAGGEGHDQPFMILDALDGRAIYVPLRKEGQANDMGAGMIVTVSPIQASPRKSDMTIAGVAAGNDGLYSETLHKQSDSRASPEYIRAHIRRLEALRRAGISKRFEDGTWSIPGDYLDKVKRHQLRWGGAGGVDTKIEAWKGVDTMIDAAGLTWLDQKNSTPPSATGFGEAVRSAKALRMTHLVEQGLITNLERGLTGREKETLERRGVDAAGQQTADPIGKVYQSYGNQDQIEGRFTKSIVRPEGKFAVIERQNSFSLVPWRSGFERAHGKQISIEIRGRSMSWALMRGRGGRS